MSRLKTPRSTAKKRGPQNSAGNLPASTGSTRTYPVYQPWSSKEIERMQKSRDRVQISRFLQEKIPQLEYACQSLPREATGKGIALKSVSANRDFAKAATAHFRLWADSPAVDLRKEKTFYDLQPRWLSAMLGEGECLPQIVMGDETTQQWSLHDRSRRAIQIQTFLRDQLTSGAQSTQQLTDGRWMDGLKFNQLEQLETVRINTSTGPLYSQPTQFTDIQVYNQFGQKTIFHLKNDRRFNQYHGDPTIFQSNEDLLDYLDLKALRKHSAKVRSTLMGATTTRDGKTLKSMQNIMVSEQTGTPATDTGRRFVEIGEGAVFLPMSTDEAFNFFTSTTEAVPFRDILQDLLYPFIFGFGYPPEWIFMRGKVGGTEYRGLIEQVRRAHQNLRLLLQPLLQWIWEKVIGNAMMKGGALEQFATVEDWAAVDQIADPDPSVDLGRDNKGDMERMDANLLTAADYIEARYGHDADTVRKASVREKIDLVAYAIEYGKTVKVPSSIATILAIPSPKLQAASGLVAALSPETIAADLAAASAPAS